MPHSPTGQSIVERVHQTIKRILEQQREGVETSSPIERLCKALYVINFLNNSFMEPNPRIIRHFSKSSQAQHSEKLPVLIKYPKAKQIMGPFPLVTWRRGCVSSGSGPKWISGKNVKPCIASPDSAPTKDPDGETDKKKQN